MILILVTVSVRTVINSGLFGHAKNAVQKWKYAENTEIEDLNIASDTIDTIINGETDFLPIEPIYARLYTDGTFILSSSDYKDPNKTISKDYGDISENKYSVDNLPEWSSEAISKVLVYDKVQPVNTARWFHRTIATRGKDTIKSMDLSNLDTSKVKRMDGMFYNCDQLTSLDLSKFDTKNAITMEGMFSKCSELTSLDLSNFNTSKVTNMQDMFIKCEK